MTILGIGIDVVHLPRIAAILRKKHADRFARRILSPAEYSSWLGLRGASAEERDLARFMAVRFSVKEAAFKAIYPIAHPTWKELTYQGFTTGVKPSLTFSPASVPSPRIGRIHVSVSHDGEYVFSQVLVEESQ